MTKLSTGDVLNHHLTAFGAGDLSGVLADYAPQAVLFSPAGPLRGLDAIKPLFEALIAEFAKPGSTLKMRETWIDGDHACIVWDAETADNSYEFGTDTFVVKDGKIVAQSFAAKIRSKRSTLAANT